MAEKPAKQPKKPDTPQYKTAVRAQIEIFEAEQGAIFAYQVQGEGENAEIALAKALAGAKVMHEQRPKGRILPADARGRIIKPGEGG